MQKRSRVRKNEGFVFSSGQIAETRKQMIEALKSVSPDVFRSHVNEQKNDIYNWLHDCLDEGLAEKIKDVRDREQMITLMERPSGSRKRRAE
jgi:hypothetical protein